MRRVISYAYFIHEASIYNKPERNAKRYLQFVQFLPMLVRAHHVIYPGWEFRIAFDKTVMTLPYWDVLVKLSEENLITLSDMPDTHTLCGVGGMLERFRPAFSDGNAIVLSRDIDSIPTPRERRATEEWLESGKAVHAIHGETDQHCGICGGLVGIQSMRFRELIKCDSLAQFIQRGTYYGLDWNRHGSDQDLLNQHWNLLASETLVHELGWGKSPMPGAEIRKTISGPAPSDIPPIAAGQGDQFAKILGGCEEPLEPFLFYDGLDHWAIKEIQKCEREVGMDAKKLLEDIRAL